MQLKVVTVILMLVVNTEKRINYLNKRHPVNTDKILTRLSVHTEKYCPKQKIVSPELARAIRFLLRAIFQVWTDKRVNIVLINSCHTILYPFMSIVITVCYCL